MAKFPKKKIPYPTPSNQCWPGGVPFVFWTIGMQMLQRQSHDSLRERLCCPPRVYEPHASGACNALLLWDSVGHYEGDTLVIDTVGVKVGPFAMVDQFGTPLPRRCTSWNAGCSTANESGDRGESDNFRLQVSDTGLARNPDYKGPGTAARVYGRGPGRVHNPLVSQDYLSASAGRNSSALKARAIMWAERSTFRMPTN
jgi:hypothetical protein